MSAAQTLAPGKDKCVALRALLSDGRWHSMSQLQDAGGYRYGGRIHEIRRGEDGRPPLAIETKRGAGNEWLYRATTRIVSEQRPALVAAPPPPVLRVTPPSRPGPADSTPLSASFSCSCGLITALCPRCRAACTANGHQRHDCAVSP